MAEIVVKLVNGELAGQTAQTIAKNVGAAAQELKKAEVGTKAWVDAANKLEGAKKVQADYKKQLDSTTAASNTLKQSFSGILGQIPGFSQISGAMQSAKGGVGGLTSGFGLLKGAIAATGIGLLVIAVSTLVMWFSKTEAGGNVLAGTFRALGAIVNVLFGKMMEIGKSLFAAFQNPKQLLSDLVDFIGNNLLNRLKSFVVIWDGIKNFDLKKVTDGFIQMGTGIENATDKMAKLGSELADAAKEGYNFVQAMDDLEDRQAAMEVAAKKNDILVDQLLLQAKNIGKSFEERIALLDKADIITRDSYAQQLALSKEYLAAVNKEIDAEKKQQGVADDTDEMRDKRKDAELAYLNLKGQQIQLEEKIANRREQILGKQEKDDEKQLKALEKLNQEKQKAYEEDQKAWQKIEDNKITAMDEGRDKDLAKLQLSLQREIEALDVNAPSYAASLASAQELARAERDKINDKWDKVETDKTKKAAEEQKKIASEKASFETKMAAVRIDSEKAVVDEVGDLLAQGVKDQQAAKAIKKIIGLADIGFNLGKELSANALAAAENPLNGITFGAAGAAQLGVMNTKSIIFAAINAGRVLAFQKGGYTGGGGSDDQPAGIVHQNEYVVPARIVRNPMYSPLIGTLESARTRGFQVGGFTSSPPVNPFRDRSPAGNGTSSGASAEVIDYNKLAALLAEHTRNEIHKIEVTNNLQSTQKGLGVLNQLSRESDL